MGRTLVLLISAIVVISWVNNGVQSVGMIEVFRWKQMDFYNRGDNFNTGPMRPNRPYKDSIVFPDQIKRYAKRDTVRMTSRDDPPSSDSRFGGRPMVNRGRVTNSSSYIPYNNVPMGATHYNGRLFITMPRRRTGIPSTLNYIDLQRDGNNPSPKLYAYPNYETNFLDSNNIVANTNRLISVYRTTVDACRRLWFVDTGMLEYPDNRMQVQRPSIWVIDLNTDQVIRKFPIPETIVDTGRGLASIAVDVRSRNCDTAFAYLPDLVNNRLYVYSFANNRIWSFSHNYFNFDPIAGDLNIGGQSFRWDDGIFSVTLGAVQSNGYRPVYFHAMASNNEFVVSSEVLQNEANAARSDHGQDFQLLGSRGNSRQSTMHQFDPTTGIIFYDEIQRNGVGCWNTRKPFSERNHGTVIQDDQNMIYPSDLTIDDQGTMWVMANSMPIFIYSTLDTNVYNFHVWKQNVAQAARGSVCA